jgi:hypothetical protein
MLLPTLAKMIGLNEAVLLQQIQYWVSINKKFEHFFVDGHYWVPKSYADWEEDFPFWSADTIKRTALFLEEHNLLVTRTDSTDPFNRKKWYRPNYETLAGIESGKIPPPFTLKSPHGGKRETKNNGNSRSGQDAPIVGARCPTL